jgi:4-hydroxymandelate oxidase
VSDQTAAPTYRAIGSDEWMAAEDLEQLARARLNPTLFDFVSGAAGDEFTLAANLAAFRSWRLRPRAMTRVERIRLDIEAVGTALAMPVYVSPMGRHWAIHPEGEGGSAAGAAAAGAGFVLSSDSPQTMAAVAREAGPERWYQLYFRFDRAIMADLVASAEANGYKALCVTVDSPVLGLRRKDVRNSFQAGRSAPLGDEPAPKPAPAGGKELYPGLRAFAPTTWDDIDWLRAETRLPILIKGILDPADAALAADHGADGVIVSNHGGRQLDQTVAALDALPDVVEAAGGTLQVFLDGGVRRGVDVAIALALGARAVGVGRPVLWALAVDGHQGVERYLRSLAADLARTLALLGIESVAELGPRFLAKRA